MAPAATSWCLAFWVGLVCPSLCAIGPSMKKQAGTTPKSCCQHDTQPEAPSVPDDSSKGSCFCSGHGLQITKVYSAEKLLILTLHREFAVADLPISLANRLLSYEFVQFHHPPDFAHLCPLLI